MKHVIVLCTSDEREPIDEHLQRYLVSRIEKALDAVSVEHYIQSSFNVSSAIAAVHEMYGAPAWRVGVAEPTTLTGLDLYNVALTLAKGYCPSEDLKVTDEDINVAYSAVCSLQYLFNPVYLIQETRKIRDSKEVL